VLLKIVCLLMRWLFSLAILVARGMYRSRTRCIGS